MFICCGICAESLRMIVCFLFEQKTAYEVRISDWSSDVCSSDKLHVGAGGPRDLAAPARLQLHVMDDGADRDGAQRHRVARLAVGALTGDDSVADRQALLRQDVALLAVPILAEQSGKAAVKERGFQDASIYVGREP